MYYSVFGILSLAILVLINFKILIKPFTKGLPADKLVYRFFLFSVILYFLSDIIWGLAYEKGLTAWVYADTVLYFIAMALTVMLWSLFIVKYLIKKNLFTIILLHSGRIMFIAVIFCLALNLFYPIAFKFESDGTYTPLVARTVFLGAQILLFAVAAIYNFILVFRTIGRERQRNFTVAVSSATMMVFILLQNMDPFIPYYAIGCLFAVTLIHSFLSMEDERDKSRILADALEAAEKANSAKTVFLTGMSHEIRTPINTILGMNEIIRRDCTDERILDCTENIKASGNRLLNVVSDILDYSKMESGKMELLDEDYSLPDMVGELYNMIRPRAEKKGLTLVFDIDSRLPKRLYGDVSKIKRVITNLLENAEKFTESGSILFRIHLLDKQGEHARLGYAVIDTGIGIRDEEKDKLFQAFNRLDTKRTCTIEGVGLGLSIASNILQLMGTKLCVESTYNEGSTFHFEVIQRIAEATEVGENWMNAMTEEKPVKKGSVPFVSPESHILLIDDTELNLKVIKGLIDPLQIQIDTALSGDEGIEKFASKSYDLVFLDYMMPGMNGIATLAKMKRLYPEKTAFTPTISLTASAIVGEREHMLDAGFTDYMTKPVIFPEMVSMLTKYLPKEKIHSEQEALEIKKSASITGIPVELYGIKGINIEEAVEYCGTPEIYMDVIGLFTEAIDEKTALLEDCIARDDINLFTIHVHALKSSLLTIGIDDLSEKAKDLEILGKEGNSAQIKEKLPAFISEYRSLKAILTMALSSWQKNREKGDSED